jgi:hypothetical protein
VQLRLGKRSSAVKMQMMSDENLQGAQVMLEQQNQQIQMLQDTVQELEEKNQIAEENFALYEENLKFKDDKIAKVKL